MLDKITEIISSPIDNLLMPLNPVNIVEIGIIALVMFIVYKKFIQGTQSEKLLRGIIFLLIALLFSKFLIILKLQILGKFLETIVSIILFGLVVVFQPELRRFLGYLGQPGLFSKNFFSLESDSTETMNILEEMTEAIKYLSKTRTGALMVIQNAPDSGNYFEVGTKLNALISQELLLTIFHPNTALHDGAIIIHGDKILSAGVLLPLTEDPKLSWKYGTRHRAAIGMSEISDSVCLVVSEESGDVSIVQHGEIKKCESVDDLKHMLIKLFGYDEQTSQASKNSGFTFNNIFSGELPKFPNILKKEDKKGK